MREKMLKIADRLIKRAEKYEEPFRGDKTDFIASGPSYAIASALREVAYQIREELKDNKSKPKREGPKFHYCAREPCLVRIFDPKEKYCENHAANIAMGVESEE